MIYASEKMAYDGKKYTMPLWQLDTDSFTVVHFNEASGREERIAFHSECVRYYIDYTSKHHSSHFEELVNNGEILSHLENMKEKIYKAIDRQVELWKAEDSEYLTTVAKGDFINQAKIENMFEMMAKEMVYATMIYA